MKTIYFSCLLMLIFATPMFGRTPSAINEKVLKNFNATFPEAQQPVWNTYDSYYEVYFTKPDRTSYRIDYDFDGEVTRSFRYYDEASLSPFIKAKVSERYPGKKIAGITEIGSNEEFYYYIVLEDRQNIYNIKSDATGNISLEKRLTKTM
jgi:hypothetical protein